MKYLLILAMLFIPINCFSQCDNSLHLVVLSGQSNMYRMPLEFFTDAVNGEIGTNHTVFVKHAIGGMPISMWDEDLNGQIYSTLIGKVYSAIDGRDLNSITFIWMQGEADVYYRRVGDYQRSFDNLLYQLRRDLDREDIRLIIGRINDWGRSDDWYALREIQEHIGDTYPHAVWVDTDDLNGPWDTAHLSIRGYKELAERYADIVLGDICSK